MAAGAVSRVSLPFDCDVRNGRPVLTPSSEHVFDIEGPHVQHALTVCSPIDDRRCRTLMLHRFVMTCAGQKVAWIDAVASVNEPELGQMTVENGRMHIRPGRRFEALFHGGCQDGGRFDPSRSDPRCFAQPWAERRSAVIVMPPGFAPLAEIGARIVVASVDPPTKGRPAVPAPSAKEPQPEPVAASPTPAAPPPAAALVPLPASAPTMMPVATEKTDPAPAPAAPAAAPALKASSTVPASAPAPAPPAAAPALKVESALPAPPPAPAPPTAAPAVKVASAVPAALSAPAPLPDERSTPVTPPPQAAPLPKRPAISETVPHSSGPAPAPAAPVLSSWITVVERTASVVVRPEDPLARLEREWLMIGLGALALAGLVVTVAQRRALRPPSRGLVKMKLSSLETLAEGGSTDAQICRDLTQTAVSVVDEVRAAVDRLNQAPPLKRVLLRETRIVEQRLTTILSREPDGQDDWRKLRVRLTQVMIELNRLRDIGEGALKSLAAFRRTADGPKDRLEAYQVLGVNPDVSERILKKLVDALRACWHPDLARDEADRKEREARIKEINIAWDLIIGKRAEAA